MSLYFNNKLLPTVHQLLQTLVYNTCITWKQIHVRETNSIYQFDRSWSQAISEQNGAVT